MKHLLSVSAAAIAFLALSSCSGKLGSLSADNFTVTPSPLEVVGDVVPATINGRFPEKYMKKKAVVTVVPELRYAGTKTVGQSATFQGENVVGNDQTIAYKVGGNYVMRTNFPYTPAMDRSELYLTFDACIGNKRVAIPEVKVADGVLATSQLVYRTLASATTATAADGYQQQISRRQDAQIKYLINQAKVRTSELNRTSVQDFVKMLREIKADRKNLALDNISLYQDPEEREQQIRNISVAFTELADEVLPELRRARLAINYRVVGRTDDEIREQYVNDASKLSVEEVLYAATLTNNLDERKAIFEKATRLYPNDKRAHNGLAQIAYAKGDLQTAKAELAKAAELPEANANAALIAVREHRLDQAEALLGKALTVANYNEVLGNLLVARGNFVQAAQTLKGVNSNTAALAQILTKDYVSARQTLTAVPNRDAMTAYLTALLGARTGDVKGAAQALATAFAADRSLVGLAQTDLELAKVLAAHPELVK